MDNRSWKNLLSFKKLNLACWTLEHKNKYLLIVKLSADYAEKFAVVQNLLATWICFQACDEERIIGNETTEQYSKASTADGC